MIGDPITLEVLEERLNSVIALVGNLQRETRDGFTRMDFQPFHTRVTRLEVKLDATDSAVGQLRTTLSNWTRGLVVAFAAGGFGIVAALIARH